MKQHNCPYCESPDGLAVSFKLLRVLTFDGNPAEVMSDDTNEENVGQVDILCRDCDARPVASAGVGTAAERLIA